MLEPIVKVSPSATRWRQRIAVRGSQNDCAPWFHGSNCLGKKGANVVHVLDHIESYDKVEFGIAEPSIFQCQGSQIQPISFPSELDGFAGDINADEPLWMKLPEALQEGSGSAADFQNGFAAEVEIVSQSGPSLDLTSADVMV